MIQVDARGLSCPQPVLLVKKAIAQKANQYSIIVDNETAVQNVKRFMLSNGYSVDIDNLESDYVIKASK
ncbi:MAG: sulfurtransferase TusA family protein [Proteocatella sp.]